MVKGVARLSEADSKAIDRITELKLQMGSELLILGHYYQRLPISLLSDHLGDSFQLSALAAKTEEAKYIVFCGVDFMAESAEILRAPHQKVFHPDTNATCPMADMANLQAVQEAYDLATKTLGKKIIPVAYMNTSSEIKAFCGKNGGLICTSSNAQKAFQWAYDRGDAVMFVPDEHLGVNTADALKIPMGERAFYDPKQTIDENLPRLNDATRLILWKGFCHVHTWFTPEHIRKAREEHPDATVIVHPECPREVVAEADHNGSTAFIRKHIEQAAAGSTTLIGTEMNMVEFLRHQYGRDKTILPLSRSFCPNMFKINLQNLVETLENLESSRNRVHVDSEVKEDSQLALSRMLELA